MGNFACCRTTSSEKDAKKNTSRIPVYKKSRMYIGICLVYACILLLNTIIYAIGLVMISKDGIREQEQEKHASSRLIFLTLRGFTIMGTDLFAFWAVYWTRISKLWIAFGFSIMSLILSIVNSALNPSTLSRIDLDFDILCFAALLVLIREGYQFRKKLQEREVIHGLAIQS